MKIKKVFLATILASAILAVDGAIAQSAVFVTTAPRLPERWVWLEDRLAAGSFGQTAIAMGRETQRVRLDARQMATPASGRCGMGWTELAAWSWRLHLRCGPLALNETRSLDLHFATAKATWRGGACRLAKPGPGTRPSKNNG